MWLAHYLNSPMQFLISFGFNFLGLLVVGWYFIFRGGPCTLGGRPLHIAIMLRAKKVGKGWEASKSVALGDLKTGIRFPTEQPDSLVAEGKSLGPALLNGASLSNLLPAVQLFLPPYSPSKRRLAPFKCPSSQEITEMWKVGLSISPCWIWTIDCKLLQIQGLLPFMCVTLHFGPNHICSCIYNINNFSCLCMKYTQNAGELPQTLSERESVLRAYFLKCAGTPFLKIVSIFEMFVNGFCSLSSNLRAVSCGDW